MDTKWLNLCDYDENGTEPDAKCKALHGTKRKTVLDSHLSHLISQNANLQQPQNQDNIIPTETDDFPAQNTIADNSLDTGNIEINEQFTGDSSSTNGQDINTGNVSISKWKFTRLSREASAYRRILKKLQPNDSSQYRGSQIGKRLLSTALSMVPNIGISKFQAIIPLIISSSFHDVGIALDH